MKIRFLISLICLFFVSCKKDISVSSNNNQGANSDQTCIDTLKIPTFNDTSYHFPRFNPANPKEIIYVQGIQSTDSSRLIKKNIITGTETFIIDNIWGMPDWSVKDWIVFNHADNQVWKIKSNGDSLTLLTTNMQGGFYPIWSPDGTKIAYKNTNATATLICDAKGNYIDSLPYQVDYLSQWSKDGMSICGLAKASHVNIAYQNVISKLSYQPTNNVVNSTNSNLITCYIGWTPDSQNIIWCNWLGLYKTNISTKQTILLKKCCNQKYYISLSVSPDGQKIIAERSDVPSGLCLMDIDGSNEVIIK